MQHVEEYYQSFDQLMQCTEWYEGRFASADNKSNRIEVNSEPNHLVHVQQVFFFSLVLVFVFLSSLKQLCCDHKTSPKLIEIIKNNHESNSHLANDNTLVTCFSFKGGCITLC